MPVGRDAAVSLQFCGREIGRRILRRCVQDDVSAKNYASHLAASFQHRMPDICDGSYISLMREGKEIAKFLLSTTH